MVILQEYLLENLQNIQTPLQINTVKPLTPAIKKKTNNERNQRNEQRILMDDHDFPQKMLRQIQRTGSK
jgi:hypothetical protein